ncbi:hypothetical protein AB0I51_27380 [Streptomyces sp. NPDC050549]|uniref:hypothetical protein n=1 Tax=Streptomyces sp. NPDC050549 TaxID=3155406 RepID=UPI0034167A83
MRRLHALWAVAGTAGLLAGALTPATAAAGSTVSTHLTGPSTTPPQTVTLITGDTVTLTVGPDGKNAVDVRRGEGREAATYLINRADGKRALTVGLPVAKQSGSIRASSLKAWVSYDDGASWKEMSVTKGEARFRPVKGAASVSLRVRATDRDGNAIDQTVLRAFGLK